jgi:hypothetical protein
LQSTNSSSREVTATFRAKFLYRAETGLYRSPYLAIELGKSKPSGRIVGKRPVLHISTSSVASD